jgi:sugar O-acyltransferase (sialic acid O-acetyltransferase NeuD family)
VSSGVRKLVIVGAGGFAREVAWLVRDINRVEHQYEFMGYVVSDLSRVGEHDSKQEILGDYNWIEKNSGKVDALAMGIGTPAVRKNVATELEARFPKLEWPKLVHPTTQFDRGTSQVQRGVLLCAGVIGTIGLVIEAFSMVNLACTIGHEARIGAYAVLNPTVNISGGADLGEEVLVGTGAQILQYIRVGERATVGAGAVVTRDVPPGETVVGIPAKTLPRK